MLTLNSPIRMRVRALGAGTLLAASLAAGTAGAQGPANTPRSGTPGAGAPVATPGSGSAGTGTTSRPPVNTTTTPPPGPSGSGSTASPGSHETDKGLDMAPIALGVGALGLVMGIVSTVLLFKWVVPLREGGGSSGPSSPSVGMETSFDPITDDGPVWEGYLDFREDVLGVMREIQNNASKLVNIPTSQKNEWDRRLRSCVDELKRAPLTQADRGPLKKLFNELFEIRKEIGRRVEKSKSGNWSKSTLDAITMTMDALHSAMSNAGRGTSSPASATTAKPIVGESSAGEVAALRAAVNKAENQLEAHNGTLASLRQEVDAGKTRLEELAKEAATRADLLEMAKWQSENPPTLGKLLEAEFRRLCESQADKLEADIANCGPAKASSQPMPPVVEAALRLARAAEQVTGQAVMDPALSPPVKGQLSNLTTVASYMIQAAPGGGAKTEAPSVAGIRALPDRPEARWNPNLLLQAGNIFEAQRMYWTRVTNLLKTEAGVVEQWLSRSAGGSSSPDAAVQGWLTQYVLPLVDQVSAVVRQDSDAYQESTVRSRNRKLAESIKALQAALEGLVRSTGMESFTAHEGDAQRPDARVLIEYADEGMAPHTVLRVRQVGWSWNGRVLRKLDVVVQSDEQDAPSRSAAGTSFEPQDTSLSGTAGTAWEANGEAYLGPALSEGPEPASAPEPPRSAEPVRPIEPPPARSKRTIDA